MKKFELNQMLYVRKIFKSYLMLIGLAMSISFIVFSFQSCAEDNYYEIDKSIDRTAQINNFKNTMITANNNLMKNSLTQKKRVNRQELAVEYTKAINQDALSLIKSYGVTEQEIISEFGSLDSEKIALTAEAIVKAEELIDNGQT